MKRQKITIAIIGGPPRTVLAEIDSTGAFAIHPTLEAITTHENYTVTHIATGMCVARFLARAKAVEVANLAAACGDIFTAQGVRPVDSDAYRAFRKALKYVD